MEDERGCVYTSVAIWDQGSPNILPNCHASNDLLHRLLLSLSLVTLQICLQLCQLTWKKGGEAGREGSMGVHL